jgi:hypothetical protein
MELPSVLRSLPSRSSTVTVSKALLRLGRLLVQLLGVAVDGKLTRLRSRSASLARITWSGWSTTVPPHSGIGCPL